MRSLEEFPTPLILVDRARLEKNINFMQSLCDRHGVELRPHLKSHKMVAVATLQKQAGARGFTCAKLGEAERFLPLEMGGMFVAYPLVDPRQAHRVAALAERIPDFRVAATGEEQVAALARVAQSAGIRLDVMMAVDTGLGREGARDKHSADKLAAFIGRHSQLQLRGFYTHEGHLYLVPPAEQAAGVESVIEILAGIRDAVAPGLPIWPGCSVSARRAAASNRVQAVRPSAYVFGDMFLIHTTNVMQPEEAALTVLATVVDKPEPGLALIDAGSKTFSSDRTLNHLHGVAADGRDISVARVNEEHGFLRGTDVDALKIGERIAFIPAHVCPVLNLTDEVVVAEHGNVTETWPVDARGRTQ